MTERDGWNARIIEEFRTNEGRVGGPFTGVPIVLVHHVGRRSGTERVSPLAYLPGEAVGAGDDVVYVFASKAGAPTNPDWYHNLVSAGSARIERGTPSGIVSEAVTVRELRGDERDTVYAVQAARVPGFAGYAAKAEGIRTIPVIELRRVV